MAGEEGLAVCVGTNGREMPGWKGSFGRKQPIMRAISTFFSLFFARFSVATFGGVELAGVLPVYAPRLRTGRKASCFGTFYAQAPHRVPGHPVTSLEGHLFQIGQSLRLKSIRSLSVSTSES